MGKPRMIILVRHAQSEGNKNRDIHQTVPDHRVKLTAEGRSQAHAAGLKLRSLLRPSDTLHFFTSPYRRTRETTEGILDSLTSSYPSPSPFPRHTIKVYEEPRLREQDFGNFQPSSAEMSRMWQERADYGHFFYRIPNGESAADAYDRISGFNESLWRQFGEDGFASVCVLVTHGLMTRVFLMKWYHFSVEYFEDLRNVNHCEFVVMKLAENGKYELKNQLRTWSELRREKERERQVEAAAEQAVVAASPQSPVPVRKTWGQQQKEEEKKERGRNYFGPRRQNTADLFADEMHDGSQQFESSEEAEEGSPPQPPPQTHQKLHDITPAQQRTVAGGGATQPDVAPPNIGISSRGGNPLSSTTEEEEEAFPSPSSSPSPTSPSSPHPKPHTQNIPAKKKKNHNNSMALALNGELSSSTPAFSFEMGDEAEKTGTHRARADTLGDQSDVDDDSEAVQELRRREIAERSFEGSVL